jgi:hypothetical protein
VDAVACNAALMACDERKLSEEWQNGQNGQNGQNWQMVLELLHDLHGRQVQRTVKFTLSGSEISAKQQ